jgi:hypothetical protein
MPAKVNNPKAEEYADTAWTFILNAVVFFLLTTVFFLGYAMAAPLFHAPMASYTEILGLALAFVSVLALHKLVTEKK